MKYNLISYNSFFVQPFFNTVHITEKKFLPTVAIFVCLKIDGCKMKKSQSSRLNPSNRRAVDKIIIDQIAQFVAQTGNTCPTDSIFQDISERVKEQVKIERGCKLFNNINLCICFRS